MKEYSWISLQCEFSWASQLGITNWLLKGGREGFESCRISTSVGLNLLPFEILKYLKFSPSNKGLPAVPERLCGGLQSLSHLLLWETYSQDNDLPKPRVQGAILIQQLLQKDITSNSPFIQQNCTVVWEFAICGQPHRKCLKYNGVCTEHKSSHYSWTTQNSKYLRAICDVLGMMRNLWLKACGLGLEGWLSG